MNIRLTLNRPLIVEAVKNETFHKGQIDKTPAAAGSTANTPAIALAYHEQAGDETYHERIIQRSIASNLADFKSRLSDYLVASGQQAADNIVETTDGDNIILTLSVSDRFNTSLTDSLAKLAAEYVTNATLMDWWRPVNERQSALYAQFLERNITAIHRCFNKTAPKAPSFNYPTAITLHYPLIPERNGQRGVLSSAVEGDSAIDPHTLYANPWLITRGVTSEISYTITGENGAEPFDDVAVRCDNGCCKPLVSPDGTWYLEGMKPGYTIVTLFSRHNDRVFAKFCVRVTR